jgi:hypothetical protein
MHTIAVGGTRPGEEETGAEFHLTPPSHAFGNQSACIFCHGAAHLQQPVILGVLAHRLIEKGALAAIAFELLKQDHVMHIVAGESIRTGDQHALDAPLAELVSQSIQSRPVQGRATLAIITEDILGMQLLPFAFKREPKSLDLLVNGLGQGLTIGRHADIDDTGHTSPPMVREEQWTGWERRAAGSDGSIAGDIGRRDPTVAWRRLLPETDAVSASGVSWYPPC